MNKENFLERVVKHYNSEWKPVQRALVKITPEMALDLVTESKFNNRTKRISRIADYIDMMINGKWDSDNGMSIKITPAGDIIDGQKRLAAIIETEIPVWMEVAFNIPERCFKTIDEDQPRTGSDTFTVKHERNTATLSSAIDWAMKYRNRKLFTGKAFDKIYNQARDDFLDNNPTIRNSVDFITRNKIQRLTGKGGLFAGAHFLFSSMASSEKADEFFMCLATGATLKITSPIVVLRDMLIRNSTNPRKYPAVNIFAMTIKAWNAYRRGTALKVLKFGPTEPFPKII